MKNDRHGRLAILGILAGQLVFWIRTLLVLEFHGDKLKTLTFIFPFVNLAGSLMMFAAAWGIYKRRHWSGGKFILPFLASIGGMISGFFMLIESNWSFGILIPLEMACFVFAFYHLAKIPRDEWGKGRKGWRRLLRWDMLISLFFYFVLFEMCLNLFGFPPEKIFANPYFKKVDKLVLRQDYFADEAGITKISAEGRTLAALGIWKGDTVKKYRNEFPFSASTYSLFEDNQLLLADSVDNVFSNFLDSLRARPDSLLDAVGRAYLDFRIHPVNEEGFRSIPFHRFDSSDRKKVLLIGDSFTFGWSARPWTNSFADCLSAMGHIVYNSGITATDPSHYAAIARKYIPLLEPDVVVVNLFLGNDVMHYPHSTLPGEMAYYPTNAGVMMASPACERLPSADSAYRFYLSELYVDESSGPFAYLASNTSMGMIAWKALKHFGWSRGPNRGYWERNKECYSEQPVSEGYLKEIKALAEVHGAAFFCGVIPDLQNLKPDLDRDYPGLIEEMKVEMVEVSQEDYDLEEAHFNALGHRRYARFLDGLIRGK